MEYTIVTYGGAEILDKIFNAIAILFKNGSIKNLMVISASIGFLMAITKAFFSASYEYLILRFFFPILVCSSLLAIKTCTVHIEDRITKINRTVDNVPFFLAKFSEIISSLGYKTTLAIEKVMNLPGDTNYDGTGMVFGSENSLEMERYEITNPDFKKNLNAFSKQCIMYDLQFGKYGIDDLYKTDDIWQFLKNNTSPVRMIKFFNVKDKKSKDPSRSYQTCQKSLELMEPFFKKEKDYLAKQEFLKNIPNVFKALTGIQKGAKELIGQQIMGNYLNGKFGRGLAQDLAYAQQKKTYHILGGLASKSILTFRAVLEALIYASIIFIIPLVLLPGGVKYLSQWAFLVVWIQLWPPFFVILNYIMQITAQSWSAPIIANCSGLSYFANIGLQNLQQDIYAVAGYLQASIPFISYAIVKGGAGSFVHMAGSLMTPGHTAASSAAAEETRGNFSLASTSFGQMSYNNTSAFQSNTAPSQTSGFVSVNSGTHSTVFGRDGGIVHNTQLSHLREDLFNDQTMSNQMQGSLSRAESFAESTNQQYSEGLSANSKHLADLSRHMSNGENYNSNFSQREALSYQESGRYMDNLTDNLAKNHGISKSEAYHAMVGGDNWIFGGGYRTDGGEQHLSSEVQQITSGEEFAKHYSKMSDFAQNHSGSFLSDEGVRIAESYNHSFDTMQSSQEAQSSALSNLNEIRESASWMQSDSRSFRENLSQEFVEWGSANLGGGYNQFRDMELHDRGSMHSLRDQFLSEKYPVSKEMSLNGFVDPQTSFNDANVKSVENSEVAHQYGNFQSQTGLSPGNVFNQIHGLNTQRASFDHVGTHIREIDDHIQTNSGQMQQDFSDKNNSSRVLDIAKQPMKRGLDTAVDLEKYMHSKLSGDNSTDEIPGWIEETRSSWSGWLGG